MASPDDDNYADAMENEDPTSGLLFSNEGVVSNPELTQLISGLIASQNDNFARSFAQSQQQLSAQLSAQLTAQIQQFESRFNDRLDSLEARGNSSAAIPATTLPSGPPVSVRSDSLATMVSNPLRAVRGSNPALPLSPSPSQGPVTSTPSPPANPGTPMGVGTLLRFNDAASRPPAPSRARSSQSSSTEPSETYVPPSQRSLPRRETMFHQAALNAQQAEFSRARTSTTLIAQSVSFTPSKHWQYFGVNNYYLQGDEVSTHYTRANSEIVYPARDQHYPPHVMSFIVSRLQKAAADGRISADVYPIDFDPKLFDSMDWFQIAPFLELALQPAPEDFEKEYVVAMKDVVESCGLRDKKILRELSRGQSAGFHLAYCRLLERIPVLLKLLSNEAGSNLPPIEGDSVLNTKGLLKLVQDVLPDGVYKALILAKGSDTKAYQKSLPKSSSLAAVETMLRDLRQNQDMHFVKEQQYSSTKDRSKDVLKGLKLAMDAEPALSLLDADDADEDGGAAVGFDTVYDDADFDVHGSLSAFDEMNPSHAASKRLGHSAQYTAPSQRAVNWQDPVVSKRELEAQRTSRPSTGKLFDPALPLPNPDSKYDCYNQVTSDSGCTRPSCTNNHTPAGGVRAARQINAKVFQYALKHDLAVLDPAQYNPEVSPSDAATVRLRKPSSLHLASDGVPAQSAYLGST